MPAPIRREFPALFYGNQLSNRWSSTTKPAVSDDGQPSLTSYRRVIVRVADPSRQIAHPAK